MHSGLWVSLVVVCICVMIVAAVAVPNWVGGWVMAMPIRYAPTPLRLLSAPWIRRCRHLTTSISYEYLLLSPYHSYEAQNLFLELDNLREAAKFQRPRVRALWGMCIEMCMRCGGIVGVGMEVVYFTPFSL